MTSKAVYLSTPTRRVRRSRAEIERLKEVLYETIEEDVPMTVRQVFYRLVTAGQIGKTEAEYKNTVVRLLAEMRMSGDLPFDWIADNTRWVRKPRTYEGMAACLDITARCYRRALWNDQPCYVEIWLEKDALAGVIMEETSDWDVPLMVTRGYPSLSFLHSAAETIDGIQKPTRLYYFGDYDPSGVDISRNVEQRIRQLAPDADIHFERVAVNSEQIEEWSLPTRPTKRSDSRAKNFDGESVEVDAIPPQTLRGLAKSCIEGNIDWHVLANTQRIERAERETLESLATGISRAKAP